MEHCSTNYDPLSAEVLGAWRKVQLSSDSDPLSQTVSQSGRRVSSQDDGYPQPSVDPGLDQCRYHN